MTSSLADPNNFAIIALYANTAHLGAYAWILYPGALLVVRSSYSLT